MSHQLEAAGKEHKRLEKTQTKTKTQIQKLGKVSHQGAEKVAETQTLKLENISMG